MSSHATLTAALDSEKRLKTERRTRSSHMNIHAITGRRKQIRRNDDSGVVHHVDSHEAHIFWSALTILLLCIFDAHYTLLILQRGGAELNQLMDYLIRSTMLGFILIKYSLTALSLFILVAYNKRLFLKAIKIHYLIYGFLAMYTALVIYEILIWPGPLSEIYSL